jgi:hypothetical protein
LLEFIRIDSSMVAGLNANQTIMLVIALVAAGLLVWRHRSPGATQSAAVVPSGAEAESDEVSKAESDSDEAEETIDPPGEAPEAEEPEP